MQGHDVDRRLFLGASAVTLLGVVLQAGKRRFVRLTG